jgi:hypothetical protein
MPITDVAREPSSAELRWFGILILLFFSLIGALVWWRIGSAPAAAILGCFGLGVAILYYVVRSLQSTIYSAWMNAVMPLGWVVSHLVLGGIYFMIITPIAFVLRRLRSDKLERRFDPSAPSYWAERDSGDEPARYFRQF